MQSKSKTLDFTQGKIMPLILQFAFPILIGQIFQNLYNSVDAIIVGNFVGTTALAAVAASADISHLLVGFFTGLSTGAGVLFSRYFGAKDYKNLHDAIHTAMFFSALFGVIISVLGIVCTPLLLKIVSCPPDVHANAMTYLRIYFGGAVLTAIYNVGSGVLRAVGDSRDPLKFLIVSSLTNIVLDTLFVVVFKMGIAGVAIATVISQGISVVLVLRTLMGTDDVYKLSVRDLKIDRALLLKILDLGLPAAIQTCIITISNLFVQRFVNMFGSAAMAGIGAGKKIDSFIGMMGNSIGLAGTTFVSQNVGADNYPRAFRGIRTCILICMVAIAAVGIPIYFFADSAVRLFTDDPAVIPFGVGMMHVMIPLYYLQMGNSIFSNVVRGFGRSKAVMVLGLCGMVGMRQLYLNISMAISLSVVNVYIAYPVGWGTSALFVFLYYWFAVRRKYGKLAKEV